jgi:uncharacterized protein (DUF1697 family)
MNCVALIRGINVGKARRISMADLSKLFSALGYAEVRTLLNSGNVIFDAPKSNPAKLGTAIAQAIEEELEHKVVVVVVTAPQLKTIVAENPLLDVATDFSRHFVAFAPDAASLAPVQPLLKQPWKPDVLAITSRAAYLWCEAGAIDSKLSQAFGRKAAGLTLRNWATVLKLQTLVAGAQG